MASRHGTDGDGNVVASTSGQGARLTIGPLAASADRIMLQEQQAQGERVTAYSLLDAATGDLIGNGTSVGHKRIQLLAAPVPAGVTVQLRIDMSLDTPIISRFAAFAPGPCKPPSEPA